MPSRLWIVPRNDLESVTIHELLRRYEEKVLTTRQPWGASWSGLEPDVARELHRLRDADPNLVIYGVELAGKDDYRATNIDHHLYKDDDRTHPRSSIEQVAVILKVELSPEEKLVAANDREWIPGLEALKATRYEIERIRRQDREAQGLSLDEEARSRSEVAAARVVNGLMDVYTEGRPTSAHSDFAYLAGAREILVRGPSEWQYSGTKFRILASLELPEQHWSAGAWNYGYFGIKNPSEDSQGKILRVIEPYGQTGAEIHHLDIVLFWPIRLDAFGQLQKKRSDPKQKPQVWLRAYAEWIASSTGSLWKDVTDSSEDRFEYPEFVYFHPFVQDLLFPRKEDAASKGKENDPAMRILERNDIRALSLSVRYSDQDAALDVELPVASVRLHLLLTDVAVLAVRMRVPRELPIDRALDLLNQVRRVYVPYWGARLAHPGAPMDRRSPGQTPLRAQWIFKPSRDDAISDCADCTIAASNIPVDAASRDDAISDCADWQTPTKFANDYRRPPVLPHWMEILRPIQQLTSQCCQADREGLKKEEDCLRFRLLGDERMFLAASVIAADPALLSEPHWMRLAFVDEGGGGWAYSESFLTDAKAKQHHFYDRYWDFKRGFKTRYLVTGYSFLQVMDNNDFTWNVLRKHLRRHYSDLCLLALIQKASILTMSHRLEEVLRDYHEMSGAKARDRFHRNLSWLSEDFSAYMALYEFAEVSNQLQGVELFEKLREHLHVRPLFEELHMQLKFAAQMEDRNHAEWVQGAASFWLPVTLVLTWMGISLGWGRVDAWTQRLAHSVVSEHARYADWETAISSILELAGAPILFGVLGFYLYKCLRWMRILR